MQHLEQLRSAVRSLLLYAVVSGTLASCGGGGPTGPGDQHNNATPSPGPTAPSAAGAVVFWTNSSSAVPITISLDGQVVGTITGAVPVSPLCGDSRSFTTPISVGPGQHQFHGSGNGGISWNANIAVPATGCTAQQLTVAASGNTSTTPTTPTAPNNPSGGTYQAGGQFNGCVTTFYDPSSYNWLAINNGCSVPVYVLFCRAGSNHNCEGAMNLQPGRHDNTGRSSSEIQAWGGITLYICSGGYIPVDANGNYVAQSGIPYKCKMS